jgi:hypothetical protein
MKTAITAKILVLSVAMLLSGVAQATIISLGQVDLTGNVTSNHHYNLIILRRFRLEPLESSPMIWSIGGFTIDTQKVLITGADFAGRSCNGLTDLSGNGFDPNDYPPFGAFSFWDFIAPPYDISNFHEDITGPITLKIAVGYDRRRETGQGSP